MQGRAVDTAPQNRDRGPQGLVTTGACAGIGTWDQVCSGDTVSTDDNVCYAASDCVAFIPRLILGLVYLAVNIPFYVITILPVVIVMFLQEVLSFMSHP